MSAAPFEGKPKPFRDDLERRIVLPQQEIDDLEWTWGIGDIDRALQNLELERRRLGLKVILLQGLCEDAADALKNGGTFPIKGLLWSRLYVAARKA